MKETIRRAERGGFYFTVISRHDSFDVIIDIPLGTVLLRRRNKKNFTIKFRDADEGKSTPSTIHYELRNQPYDHEHPLRNFKKDFYLPGEIWCRISLAPEFYQPKSFVRKHNSTLKNGKDDFPITSGHTRSPTSGRYGAGDPVPYSVSNIRWPYQGGSVTPR